MRFLGSLGRAFWRFMVIFSFTVNIILVVVLLVAGLLIFEIKNQIAEPLVEGLHSSFVGLDQATIDWTIPVRDQIQVKLDIPLETTTVVVLQEPVPLQVNALIDLPGINAYNVNAAVDLELPVGLELPVSLDLDVAVDQPLDVELDVRAVIPLAETQLHDVANNLRLQLEPLAIALNNLPGGFDEVVPFVGDVLQGDVNLLTPNDYSIQPWPGYSMTAGLGYDLYTEEIPAQNIPMDTGIVQVGGMPFLDEQIRPGIYDVGGPESINADAIAQLEAMGIDPIFFRDGLGPLMRPVNSAVTGESQSATDSTTNSSTEDVERSPGVEDQGIIATATQPGGSAPSAVPPSQVPPSATLPPVTPSPQPPTPTPPPTFTPNPDQGILPGG